MIFLGIGIIVLIGAVSINNSLNIIKRNTSNMELYAEQIYQKSKKLDKLINNLKQSFQISPETSVC
jgi:hypothetical protein